MTGAPVPRVSPGRAPQHGLTRAWTLSVSLGELAGFCVPALVGGLLREDAPWFVLGAVVLAGVVEGAILGRSLPSTLRRHVARAARWIPIAAAGWGAGLLGSTAAGPRVRHALV